MKKATTYPIFVLLIFSLFQVTFAQFEKKDDLNPPFINNSMNIGNGNPAPNSVSAYLFNQYTGTYTPITGGTVVVTGAGIDDNLYPNLPIGFTFNFNGTPYTQFGIFTNGVVWFGTTPPVATDRTNPIGTATPFVGLVHLGYDLLSLPLSELRYQTQGSFPNRTLTVQYSTWGTFSAAADTMNFQVILYEAGDSINYVYGSFKKDATSRAPQVGFKGGSNLDFLTRTTTTNWAATTAGGSNSASQTLSSTVFPASGQTYSFTGIPVAYQSSDALQLLNGVPVYQGFANQQIIQIQVNASGTTTPLPVTNFSLGTNGSTNPAVDLTNARLYYTGTTNTFSTANLYGTFASPNGTFAIAGSQNIIPGATNYFWLAYDIAPGATPGNVIDAQCNSITIVGVQIPTTVAPAGNRPISAVPPPFCGIKNIPGDYASLTACIADLNISGVTCPTIINIAAGYTETNVNLTLTCPTNPPNAVNTLTFQKSGAGANPLLTAGTGASTTVDGIIILNGVKYVTFDGIDLQENAANVDPTTQMEWGYAMVKQSGTLACQNNTIKNCTVTLNKSNPNSVGLYTGNHTTANTTALTVTNFNGTGSYNKFYSNTVQNCFIGIRIQGFAAATPFDLYDQGNEVGSTGNRRNQVLNFGNGTSGLPAYGIFTINQNAIKIFNTYVNSTGGANNNALLNGIYLSTATNGSADVFNDTVTVVGGGTTQQLVGIGCDMGATGNGNTLNFYNNVVTGCSYPTATTGEFRGISTGVTSTALALATNTNIYDNKVTGNTQSGTGNFQGIGLAASSSTNMIVANVNNNEVSGNSKTGTAGILYMYFCSSSCQTINFFNNLAFNNSNALSSGATYGFFSFAFPFLENVHDNQIFNNTGGTGEMIGFQVGGGSGPTNKEVYNNTVNGHVGNGLVGGIFVNLGTVNNIYKNNVFNLTSNNLTLSPAAHGIHLGASTNVYTSINNNFISDLKTPSSTSLNAIYGLYIQGPAAANNIFAYYNTVYLNAVSSSATSFGTSGLFYSNITATSNLDLRNNVIVNASTPGPTSGTTKAFQRATTVLTNYNVVSGNNCFYAGTPGINRLIHTDGTNLDQTIQAFKNRVTPRDQASFTELPPFVNIATTPYDLHIQTGTGTQLEKGGQPVSVTTDYDGTTRNATFPDAGADEFSGILTDNASPLITYTLLGNADGSSPRTVDNVLITDPSGINVTAGTKPRIYYKKSTNANTFVDNTSATDGWKFVEATNAASPFSFGIDYNLVNGGIAAGNIIQYFVTAQDLNGTPRIGLNSGAFTTEPTSVNLAAANFPLTSTINQYTITTGAGLSGTINVGSTETITSLTNAGGAFALINSSSLSGNVILSITSDLLFELGTVALNQWSETGAGGYTVTIQSSTTTLRSIEGIINANSLVRLDGADRVNIDGRSGGSGQFLRFRNYSNTGPAILLINDAQDNTIRNCILEGSSTAISGLTAGVINIGTTTGLNGNDNNRITFNDIRDRSDSVKFPAICISSTGTTTSLPQFNNNITISNNNVYNFFLNGNTLPAGINVLVGTSDWNIDSNSIYQTIPREFTTTGSQWTFINIANSAIVASNGNYNVRNNFIGGSAPQCGGTPLTSTITVGTATYIFRGISMTTGQIPNTVRANTIANIDYTSNSTAGNTIQFNGISTGNGIYNITRNVIGSPTGNDNVKLSVTGTGAGFTFVRMIGLNTLTGSVFGGNMDSNSIGSITFGGTSTGGGYVLEGFSIQAGAGLVTNVSISNNLIGSTTTANSIRTNYTNPLPGQLLLIRNLSTSGSTITINNNTLQNVTEAAASTTNGLITCILSANAGANTPVITNNTVANITNNTTITTTNAIAGISVTTPSSNLNIAGNTIFGLNITNTGATEPGAIGIFLTGNNNTNGTISKNKIYGFTNQSTGGIGLSGLSGMIFNNGNALTVSNNMIAITNGESTQLDGIANYNNKVPVPNTDNTFRSVLPGFEVSAGYRQPDSREEDGKPTECIMAEMYGGTTPENVKQSNIQNKLRSEDKRQKNNNPELSSFTNNLHVHGIFDQTNSTNMQILYNTVYLGGSSTGSFNSNCYNKTQNSVVTLKNNLFYNNRLNSGGFSYAVSNTSATPSLGWLSSASNYNVFVTPDSTRVGEWTTGVGNDINQWRTVSAGDNQTWYAKTTEISPTNLFTNLAAGDLHINSSNSAAWLVSGKGIALSTIGDDFDGFARSITIAGGVTDVGADEFTPEPPAPPVAYQSAPPAAGTTTDYVLYGRKIVSITWGTGGTYPLGMAVAYISGSNPFSPNITTPQRSSNSYWFVSPLGGGLNGTTYDLTLYYGDNETYSITNPATNIILAKKDVSTHWMTYPSGNGNLQSEQNPGTFSLTTRGLPNMYAGAFPMQVALTDAALPAEFPRTPLNNSTVAALSTTLIWSKSALATSYRVQLATDSLFNTMVFNDSTVTDTTRLVSGLTDNTNYWWRVNGKISAGNVGGWSQVFKFRVSTVLPPALVNLTVIPGGFFNTGTSRLNMRDTVRVYLVDSTTCLKVDSNKVVLDSVNFSAPLSFSNAPTGNYYILVYHRNHLGVASRFRQTVTRGGSVNYDFTTDSTKTFGFNAVKVSTSPLRWAMMPGDANRDGFVDGLDQTIWIGQNGFDGYLAGDFNGDNFVDGLDQTIWIIFNGNGSFLPCGFFLDPLSERLQVNTPDYDAKRSNKILFERKRKTESDTKIYKTGN